MGEVAFAGLVMAALFIAYIANIASPFFILSPSFTNNFDIVPGIGAFAFFSALESFATSAILSDSKTNPVVFPRASNKWTD